jgi:ribosomal protein L24
MSLLQADDQAAWQTVVDVYQERKKVIIENIKLKEQ